MALQKQPVAINFAQGLDTKSDPWQIPIGKFFRMINSVFTKAGQLIKRNGFANLPTPPHVPNALATFQGNLEAIGPTIMNFNQGTQLWTQSGPMNQTSLTTAPLVRSSLSQYALDAAVSANNLTCTVYLELRLADVTLLRVVVTDTVTGQNVISPRGLTSYAQALPIFAVPRVFLLGTKFVVLYVEGDPATNELKYLTIDINTLAISLPTSFSPSIILDATYPIVEGAVFTFGGQTNLYIAYHDTSGDIKLTYLTTALTQGPTASVTPAAPIVALSVTGDSTNGDVWVSYNEVGTGNSYSFWSPANTLATVNGPYLVFTGLAITNYAVTSLATAGVLTSYISAFDEYGYNSSILTDSILLNTVTNTGTVGTQAVMARSVGLASKAFIINGMRYMMGLYVSPNQSTLFLLNDSGQVISRLAYGNAGSYPVPAISYIIGPPTATVIGENVYIPYLLTTSIEAVNKTTSASTPSGTQVNGIYSQIGINQATFNFSLKGINSVEIGGNLNISGGFLWNYDGLTNNENNFFLYPDSIMLTDGGPATGNMSDQQYFYQVIYEFEDNAGNIIRSAPSIPVTITLADGGSGSVVIDVPTLRLTYKQYAGSTTPIKIQIYRWSVSQPVYYQITATEATPFYNDPSQDFLSIRDEASDAEILGNEILYTTGGVLENEGAPATAFMTIFDNRLWLIDAEDRNLLWFSKQVIEDVPVEFSSALTYFVAPALGSQGPTGPVTALHPLDDKLIIFKKNDIAYINGQGPDNTGLNSTYSQSILITTTSGCISPLSLALTPVGLTYQSDKGIWILGRDLSTRYIGSPVENYTQFNTNSLTQPMVVSALVIPDTTQVRFMLDTGVTLTYDYFYDQWDTFQGITAQESTLYQALDTFIDQSNVISQETPGVYADGSNPVNMSFQTGWINLTGLQGYERVYYFYLLGQYYSNHTLTVQIAYDYDPTIVQTSTIIPIQVAPPPASSDIVEQWRVFFQRGKCQAVQLTITETDGSVGKGLSLSGINMVIGRKKGYPVRRQNLSVG